MGTQRSEKIRWSVQGGQKKKVKGPCFSLMIRLLRKKKNTKEGMVHVVN